MPYVASRLMAVYQAFSHHDLINDELIMLYVASRLMAMYQAFSHYGLI